MFPLACAGVLCLHWAFMPFATMRPFFPTLGLAVALPACVAGPAAAPVEWRVAVKLAPSVPETDVAAQAAKASGVPVRYFSASGGRWHSVGLQCANDTQCADALRRLQAAPAIEAVERAERHRRHGVGPGIAASST